MTDIAKTRSRKDWIVMLPIYMVASAIRFCAWAFSTGDCHGTGAEFPGGCPAFSSGMDLQTIAFVAGGLALLVLIQRGSNRFRPGMPLRLFILLLYAVLLLVGPFFLLVPPPKA